MMNNLYNSTSNSSDGYIKVTNRSLTVIKFTVAYVLKGKTHLVDTSKILSPQNKKVKIPSGATRITFQVVVQDGFRWRNVFLKDFDTMPKICYVVTGATKTNLTCRETPCSSLDEFSEPSTDVTVTTCCNCCCCRCKNNS